MRSPVFLSLALACSATPLLAQPARLTRRGLSFSKSAAILPEFHLEKEPDLRTMPDLSGMQVPPMTPQQVKQHVILSSHMALRPEAHAALGRPFSESKAEPTARLQWARAHADSFERRKRDDLALCSAAGLRQEEKAQQMRVAAHERLAISHENQAFLRGEDLRHAAHWRGRRTNHLDAVAVPGTFEGRPLPHMRADELEGYRLIIHPDSGVHPDVTNRFLTRIARERATETQARFESKREKLSKQKQLYGPEPESWPTVPGVTSDAEVKATEEEWKHHKGIYNQYLDSRHQRR